MVKTRYQCSYCGSTWYIEEEHPRAKSRGGIKTVLACQACNRSKGDKTLSNWLDWLKENDSYRWNRIVNYQKRKRSKFANMVRRRK